VVRSLLPGHTALPLHADPDSEHLYEGAMRNVPSVNEADMSHKPTWMRNLPLSDTAGIQAKYEGKLEELADLDSKGMHPILDALEATDQLTNTVIFFTSDTTCEIAGVPFASLEVDGRSMLPHLGTDSFSGWRKRMLVTGSDDVGWQLNPGGSNERSGRWWLLREGEKVFILRENGAKELYSMGSDPYQEWSKARSADPALIERLTTSVKDMRAASGATRRQLEAAP
jgi:N-acetylglucosamine-6-sulfatase